MRTIMIASYHHPREGEQARGHLADAGIDSLLHADRADVRPEREAEPIRLFVRAQDADRARALLDDADDLGFR